MSQFDLTEFCRWAEFLKGGSATTKLQIKEAERYFASIKKDEHVFMSCHSVLEAKHSEVACFIASQIICSHCKHARLSQHEVEALKQLITHYQGMKLIATQLCIALTATVCKENLMLFRNRIDVDFSEYLRTLQLAFPAHLVIPTLEYIPEILTSPKLGQGIRKQVGAQEQMPLFLSLVAKSTFPAVIEILDQFILEFISTSSGDIFRVLGCAIRWLEFADNLCRDDVDLFTRLAQSWQSSKVFEFCHMIFRLVENPACTSFIDLSTQARMPGPGQTRELFNCVCACFTAWVKLGFGKSYEDMCEEYNHRLSVLTLTPTCTVIGISMAKQVRVS